MPLLGWNKICDLICVYSYKQGNEGLRYIIWEALVISIGGGLREHDTQTFARWEVDIPDPLLRHDLDHVISLLMLLWCCGVF